MRYKKSPSSDHRQDFREDGPAPHGSIASRAKRAMGAWMETLPEDERGLLNRRLLSTAFDVQQRVARSYGWIR